MKSVSIAIGWKRVEEREERREKEKNLVVPTNAHCVRVSVQMYKITAQYSVPLAINSS